MFEVMEDSSGNYVALKTMGKITSKDYDILIPYLEEAIKEEGRLNISCDMTNFEGVELKAAWRDFSFGLQHKKDFNRCALVGANKCVEWCVRIIISFFRLEVRLFKAGQEKEAKNWVKH